jgi:hypothetical protein
MGAQHVVELAAGHLVEAEVDGFEAGGHAVPPDVTALHSTPEKHTIGDTRDPIPQGQEREMTTIRGGCQCGGVRYEVTGDPIAAAMCFCTDCQAQSGSAFGMSLIVPKESFRLVKGATKSFTRPTESGSTVECAFCPDCGTRLFHLPAAKAERVNVKPGTLDDASQIRPMVAVWTRRKPDWVTIPEGLPQFERNPGSA